MPDDLSVTGLPPLARQSDTPALGLRIAVVGAGIAGLSAAWLLARRHNVTLFEAAPTLGGHSHTVDVAPADGRGDPIPVDTGFVVYNDRTYPNLISLFRHLGVATEASDMSFSVSVEDGAFEYAGASKLRGLFAQGSNAASPRFWALLREILRYYRNHRGRGGEVGLEHISLRQLLDAGGYSDDFRKLHLLPMAAAIWSGTMESLLDYPAASFLRFCDNHGLLQVSKRPKWRTVTGGSRCYVRALADTMNAAIHVSTPVRSILRGAGQTRLLTDRFGWHSFDHVVIAAHGDQALRLLTDASPRERAILGAFAYQSNTAVLHRDPRLMPRRERAWASWNYLAEWNRNGNADAASPVSVTYWLNRLQNLPSTTPLFLSLNPLREPQPHLVERMFAYDHPQFDLAALSAQRQLGDIQGVLGTWFCGSYCGHGFHEDGLRAGIAVARAFGAEVPWPTDVPPAAVDHVSPRRPKVAA